MPRRFAPHRVPCACLAPPLPPSLSLQRPLRVGPSQKPHSHATFAPVPQVCFSPSSLLRALKRQEAGSHYCIRGRKRYNVFRPAVEAAITDPVVGSVLSTALESVEEALVQEHLALAPPGAPAGEWWRAWSDPLVDPASGQPLLPNTFVTDEDAAAPPERRRRGRPPAVRTTPAQQQSDGRRRRATCTRTHQILHFMLVLTIGADAPHLTVRARAPCGRNTSECGKI